MLYETLPLRKGELVSERCLKEQNKIVFGFVGANSEFELESRAVGINAGRGKNTHPGEAQG